MRLSWPQHLQTARVVESVADRHRGVALALMGMALLMLAQDLLEQEQLEKEQLDCLADPAAPPDFSIDCFGSLDAIDSIDSSIDGSSESMDC